MLDDISYEFLITETFTDAHGKFTIENNLISCDKSVYFTINEPLHITERLPIKFNVVNGNFSINRRGLTSLEGTPMIIQSSFRAIDNKLKSLVGGPMYVGDNYNISGNQLETLSGLPVSCKGITFNYHPNLELLKLFKIRDLGNVNVLGSHSKSYQLAHSTDYIINRILCKNQLNTQQKIFLARRELVANGFESNARL